MEKEQKRKQKAPGLGIFGSLRLLESRQEIANVDWALSLSLFLSKDWREAKGIEYSST